MNRKRPSDIYTRARDNIAFFVFHTFLVEVHPNEAKLDSVPESGPNYKTAAHAFVIATLILGLWPTLGRAQK